MPAKKAAPAPRARSSSGAEWAKWVYLIGVVVAGLVGAFASFAAPVQPYLNWLLLLAGILAGVFFLDSGDVVNFGIRFLLLGATAKALDAVPAVGPYFSGFFGGVFSFLTPVGLTLLFMYFWKKYFGSMM
ncbi:MAG TPA: hypothetical protein VLX61_02955 [Anaerolineales bacterium]|nr:hypothetical protein [Anaerolineales bacterium]